ncbi:acyl transferase/acyl hydrolase/lysophospholipase [Fusarium oxysporum II5]|uniref:Calcium-independent phospholipase A2-gamma n=3 Tax=Fusarium oxysporum species complex TaxID=171631 RepID=N1S611_FUSC4|nr:uncharacterized protein FOIG_09803 [Fusarium odoratissimum NRRL 54006]EMT71987.1 Calcium-independent phospholipase A2-gamma [Fusarium odoratissimum]EXL98253.1 hypothetical protein FOIG_09803 [Fusarium odoratissimum NRRL 54006]KAK2124072.1 acyl transferase/acyl hydrolase/lysophospholipase [Fusarium oxysporum II5]TXB95842.1 hypothetical protein FocTR4_00016522 [Fusarium oxysporum f. sp. cubense]
MLTASELEEFPVLPNDTSDFTEGTYTIPCHKKKELTAEGPDIVNKIWFHTQPLDTDTIQRIHCMKLVAKSRDQGFSDDPLAGNWTWFEIAILKTKYSEEPRVKDGIQLVWVSHRNRFLSKDYGWEEGVEFGKDHDIFRLLEEGNVIAVRLCARFQAWQIKARTGYLVLDIGAPVPRKALQYGQTKQTVLSIQEVFDEVNSTILPNSMQISAPPSDLLFRAEMLTSASEKPLRVLSLDGGGVRGVAALMHLDAIMKKVAPGKKPCEVFDMIGGTSTGGFIAIMLGRLQMTIEDALKQYKKFMGTVFPTSRWTTVSLVKSGSKWDASELEKCIKQLVQEQLGQDPDQVLLLDEESAKTCKVFVMATRQEGANNQAPVLFRSYENPLEKSELPGIKLWEAARATSAAPMYFAPLEVGGYKFLDGGLQANNPMGWLWNEVLSVFGPARSTNCFLSIGTGIAAAKAVGDVRNLKGFTESVASIATNSEITNLLFRSLINAFAPRPMAKKYYRFNVGDGLPEWTEDDDGNWTWKLLETRVEGGVAEMDDITAIDATEEQAKKYIELAGAQKMIEECAEVLREDI